MGGQQRRAAVNTLCGTLFLSLALSCDVPSRLTNLLERFAGDGTTGSITGVSPLIGFHLTALLNPIESALTAEHVASNARATTVPPPAATTPEAPTCAREIPVAFTRGKGTAVARKSRVTNATSANNSKHRMASRRPAPRPSVEVDLTAHFAEAISELKESVIDHAGPDAIDLREGREEGRRESRILARELPPAEIKIIFRRENFAHTEK